MSEPQFIAEGSIGIAPTDIHTQVFRNVAKNIGLTETQNLNKPLPKILQEVPVYDYNQIISQATINETSTPEYIHHGQDGEVYGLRLSPTLKCALKIMHTSGLSRNHKILTSPENPDPNQDKHSMVYEQAAGLVLGHSIEPNYVDSPYGLVSYKGQVVGYMMPWYRGENVSISLAGKITKDQGFDSVYSRLNNGGANLDDFISGGDNALVIDNHGHKEVKIIDIRAPQEALEIDPRSPAPEGFYIPRYAESSSLFDRGTEFNSHTINSYEEIMQKVAKYETALAHDSNNNLTFNDVCEGRAMITTKKVVTENKKAIEGIKDIFRKLQNFGIDVEQHGKYCISENWCTIHLDKPNGDEIAIHSSVSDDGQFEPEKYFRLYYKSKDKSSSVIFEFDLAKNTTSIKVGSSHNDNVLTRKESSFILNHETQTVSGYVDALPSAYEIPSHPLTQLEVQEIQSVASDILPGISFDNPTTNFNIILEKIRP